MLKALDQNGPRLADHLEAKPEIRTASGNPKDESLSPGLRAARYPGCAMD